MLEPAQARVVQPFRGRDVENVPHHAQCQINGLGLDAGLSSHLDKWLQCSNVNRAKFQIAQDGIQLFQMQRIVGDAFLVSVFDQILGCRLSKSTSRSLPVDQRLACFFDSLG